MGEEPGQQLLVGPSAGGGAAAVVEVLALALLHPLVDQRVARSGVEGDDAALRVDQRRVGHAADVEDAEGPVEARRLGQRLVEHRDQRRPLPARLDIGPAQVRYDRDAEPGRQCLAVADLDRDSLVRTVDHGLPVEADHVDLGGGQAVLLQEALHGLGVGEGDEGLGFRQSPGPVAGMEHGLGVLGGGAQQRLLVVGVAR
ncbi:hypothetical protein SR39_14130 [Methylobacterium radiotolerans]|nr:hypothetical protein SR39_14130 [Methylobacterium radiotolerans]